MAIRHLLSLSRRSTTCSLSPYALRSFSATSSGTTGTTTTTTTATAPLPSPPRQGTMINDRLALSINHQELKQLDNPDPRFLKEGEHAKDIGGGYGGGRWGGGHSGGGWGEMNEGGYVGRRKTLNKAIFGQGERESKESALALQNLLFLNRSSSSAVRSSVQFCGVGTSLWKSTLLPPLMPPSTRLFHTRPGLPSSSPSESSGNSKRFFKYLEYSTKEGEHAKDIDGGYGGRSKTLNKAILMARLVRGVFWHIYDGIKEIMADYVHHEMTRNLIMVSWTLFYVIVLKDVFLFLFF